MKVKELVMLALDSKIEVIEDLKVICKVNTADRWNDWYGVLVDKNLMERKIAHFCVGERGLVITLDF